MPWSYVAYGLRVVADREIPGLAPAPAHQRERADVCVWLSGLPSTPRNSGRDPWYRSDVLNAQGRPNLVIWRTRPDGAFHFVYDDGAEFLIRADGSEVWCAWPAAATLADASVYLRGPVLGLVLRLKGVVSLHASAVAVNESAIAILGGAGAGKSTTAAGFVKLGYRLLADDVAALTVAGGRLSVLPGYPRLNLWPDAWEALSGNAAELPRVTPPEGINDWWDKRYLDLEAEQFHRRALPLAAVYVLGDRDATVVPRIEAPPPRDGFMALVDCTYVNYALDEGMRATEFRILAQLVRTTPVRLVTPPSSPARLLELCEMILGDCRLLPAESLAGC